MIPVDPRALVIATGGPGPRELAAGTRVSAPERDPLRLASADGTTLTLDPGSILTVVDVGQVRRFALLRGAVHAQVHKLGQRERFVIDTADAEVEVRGTAFRVATGVPDVTCSDRSGRRSRAGSKSGPPAITTRVIVESGVVSARAGGHEDRLYPGDSWPPPCEGDQRRAERNAGQRPSSKLSAQNDLFSAATAARKAGHTERALELFERLIREYPQSSLVEGAMAARMRLLAASRSGRAVPAAEAYLSRFPDGFARAEAAALIRAVERP